MTYHCPWCSVRRPSAASLVSHCENAHPIEWAGQDATDDAIFAVTTQTWLPFSNEGSQELPTTPLPDISASSDTSPDSPFSGGDSGGGGASDSF